MARRERPKHKWPHSAHLAQPLAPHQVWRAQRAGEGGERHSQHVGAVPRRLRGGTFSERCRQPIWARSPRTHRNRWFVGVTMGTPRWPLLKRTAVSFHAKSMMRLANATSPRMFLFWWRVCGRLVSVFQLRPCVTFQVSSHKSGYQSPDFRLQSPLLTGLRCHNDQRMITPRFLKVLSALHWTLRTPG